MKLNWPTQLITEQIKLLWPDFSVQVVEQTDSTNTQLMQQVRQGKASPALLVAETQTAGRGRLGKSWASQQTSPTGETSGSLTFSLSVPMPLENMGGLSLVIGCALADALDEATQTLQLKWPNDIWYASNNPQHNEAYPWRKLAGILIESASHHNQRYAVIGIGINISPLLPLPESITTAPASLQTAGISPGSLRQWHTEQHPDTLFPWSAPNVLERIAPKICRAVYNFTQDGLSPWVKAFQRRDLLEGSLLYTSNGQIGTGAGIDSAGNLLIKTSEGMKVIYSGEVSVRPC